ncbi:phosphodiesterase [Phaeobacter gallaeciensis]|uniref:Phosphodiesterase n=2 Tax=Roseobacteraceae TaxID=2854170 RepID=A0A366X093_9RHOB|nr:MULTISPECIES: glycerophosphodiester phosphodiesterase family protein [Roseobacteraceae]MBT3141128.1 phosphodiesterase [Falsiruegeria litorea]MBT8170873.1 phosphodiesterase [Falsiruegeria litorea]RBW54545.1 phosphodiesterase [Phaeobacter gallaeciensis]
MIAQLPSVFLGAPLAHRALHDVKRGRPENSRAAIRAAIAAGYGIEIDLQLTRDDQAMVFHDYDMKRLTGQAGPILGLASEQAQAVALAGGDGEGIPTLPEILELVAGQVPLLIELKDQDGAMGPNVGPLERATAAALVGYSGAVAVMSFNPNSTALMAELAPNIARGLVTSAYDPAEWPLSAATCDHLREIPDYERAGCSFISHEAPDLERPRVSELKAQGAAILCWTVCSPKAEAKARKVAANVTFEQYLAAHPA